ncbi:hypothetical protein [Falsiroseomonas sp. CW058]|uniref:hypothetical protein n=1 Tax=Falsiroseomonas sp. CW058 TaxID=3388664 RepID=UPI003D3178C5
MNRNESFIKLATTPRAATGTGMRATFFSKWLPNAPVLLIVACLLSACGTNGMDRQTTGTAVGAFAGGAAGALASRGGPAWLRPLAPLAGALGGALIGRGIGSYLDEQDRQRMNTAAQQALASNRVQTWSNPQSGVSGQAVPVRASGNCREVRQTITLADGTPREETITACRGANGWEVQQT